MKNSTDRATADWGCIKLALELEERLSIEFRDEDLTEENTATLADFTRLTFEVLRRDNQPYTPQHVQAEIIALIQELSKNRHAIAPETKLTGPGSVFLPAH
jgi:hypothetical protein